MSKKEFTKKEKLERKFAKILTKASPTLSSRVIYRFHTHKKLNLKNPTLFNEKLMYLKLHDYRYNDLVTKCSDKIKVRDYVKENGLDFLLNKIYIIVDDANFINFDALPDKFVLKCNHGCGYNIICTDKANFDKKEAIKVLNNWQKTKFGYESCEPHYFKIQPLIYAEKYIASSEGIMPNDYKIYCFDGEPKLILVCSEREKDLKRSFYDLNWKRLNYEKPEYHTDHEFKRPKNLEKMLEYAKTLAKPFKFVRVDFYEEDGKVIFGELTFTPARCCGEVYTDEANLELGKMLDLGDL